MKQYLLIFSLCLCAASTVCAQKDEKPQTKPTTDKPTSAPVTSKQDAAKQRRMMVQRDLIIPDMKDPIDLGDGVKYCYLRKAGAKKPLVRLGDLVKVHLTLWDQKSKRELMTTRRREGGRPHGLGTLNVGITIPGLDMVFPKLRIGDKVRIDVPSKMAFGARGIPVVPPNTDVIYALEIHEITKHVDFPEKPTFDEKKAVKIDEKYCYTILKDGKGQIAGDNGLVVYDYVTRTDTGRIIDFSKVRDHASIGGQAGKMRNAFLSSFSPLARVGTEFLVRMDFKDVPLERQPFGMSGSRYIYQQLITRWVIPFDKSTEGMKETKTGLKYEIIRPGKGPEIKPTHHVTMHYAWWTEAGDHIESSYARGGTNTLRQIALPAGMVEGIHLLKPGGKIRLHVPAKLAWGFRGRKGVPSDSNIIMLIEVKKSQQLDKVKKKPKSKPAKAGDKDKKKSDKK